MSIEAMKDAQPAVLVPVDALIKWRDAFAAELEAWDIDPPLHHVQTSHDEIDNMLTTPPAAQRQPEHKGCACRWDSEGDRTVTCERHQGWLEVIAEWADRAREAEAKLKATTPAAQRQPLTEDQIDDIWNRYCDEMGEASINDAYDIARAIEAAHGIKENT
jgi:hypothetical protein